MLRDYFWSMALVVSLLGTYTAFVVYEKRSPDSRFEPARSSASVKSKLEVENAAEAVVPAAVPGARINN